MKNKGKVGKRKAILIAFMVFAILGARIGNADDSTETVDRKVPEQVGQAVQTNENEPKKYESDQEAKSEKNISEDLNDIEREDASQRIPVIEPEEEQSSTELGMDNRSVLQVHFLDVGQALSILVMDGQGNELLYDAGNEGDAEFICSYLEELGVDRLEYMVNSHPHEDHIGGMDRVLENVQVDQVLMSKKSYDSQAYRDVMHALQERHMEVVYPKAGMTYDLGALKIQVLGPLGSDYDNTNDYSMILKIENANQSVLLVGDSEAASEHEMVEAGTNLKADVFQVSHHGSSTSNTIQYLSKINPHYAVISVGTDNRYGHPDATILDRLRNMGISTYETDLDGTIVMTLDGAQISVETFEMVGPRVNLEDDQVDANESVCVERLQSVDLQTVDSHEAVNENEVREEKPAEKEAEGFEIETGSSVVITELDKKAEFVIIKNISETAVELGGWQLISVTGSQTFSFPEGCVIKENQTLKITSYKANGSGDYIMAKGYVWNNETSDPAQLLDAEGVVVDFFQD